MKNVIFSLVLALSFFSIAHASEVTKYNASVGVESIARTVVEKELVNQEASQIILLALETGKADLGEMKCERGLGSDYCSFDVFIKDDYSTDEAEEAFFRLDVRIYQGNVVSATWNLIAG